MSRIETPLDLRYINGRRWLLIAPFVYTSDRLQRTIFIPAGFETDFNSVPRVLWAIAPPEDFGEAGVVHDWLYKAGTVTRLDADQTHREVLTLLGCPGWKVSLAYRGIRWGGWVPWRRYRQHETPEPERAA